MRRALLVAALAAAAAAGVVWWLRRRPAPVPARRPLPDYPHGEAPTGYAPALAWSGAQAEDPYRQVGTVTIVGITEPLYSNGALVKSVPSGQPPMPAVEVDRMRVTPQDGVTWHIWHRRDWVSA